VIEIGDNDESGESRVGVLGRVFLVEFDISFELLLNNLRFFYWFPKRFVVEVTEIDCECDVVSEMKSLTLS
jgi:hypothetical protein